MSSVPDITPYKTNDINKWIALCLESSATQPRRLNFTVTCFLIHCEFSFQFHVKVFFKSFKVFLLAEMRTSLNRKRRRLI